ncbi:nucleotidyltransferase [Marinisporobacter balticus]|uniref:tRNA(Met) cytidine acetate ligase n=1 Tax=Marinisporobacter balticus TaxID=2018667 RepID=A0A4R2L554_9FIRM|nr:nucleotidyltransferase [Marinisporobacter balticus]TCO78996.1 putative nucleotidyltransferase [Marinisporobacter balticus]
MKVLGLITEYNPFHNGHKYHLETSIKQTNATHTVVVMSGNFLQRGEPAITNKWVRAEMAVREGADLVIEMPVSYACNSAEFFSYGGVSLLNNLNAVDTMSFGSEAGDIHKLKLISQILANEPQQYKENLKSFLSEGISFPRAREKALDKYFSNEHLNDILHSPNNILGIEYIKSLIKLKSPIIPYTFTRIKAHYHSEKIQANICSATAIRAYLSETDHKISHLTNVMPMPSFHLLQKCIADGFGPIHYDAFDKLILYTLRTCSKSNLKMIMDVTEGLENRIKEASLKAVNLQELLHLSKTKRYTRTRLQRIFIHALLGIHKVHIDQFNQSGGPRYARILAFSEKGRVLLKKLKKTSQIPILTNINKQNLDDPIARQMLSFDTLATDIYNLVYPKVMHQIGGSDFYKKPYYYSPTKY